MEEIASIARASVALLFLVAGSAKLARPSATSAALAVLRVPSSYRFAATVVLAATELTVALVLLTVDTRAVLAAPAVMLVAFSLFLGYLAYRRKPVACGCLGDLGSENHVVGLTRNLCLLGLLAVAASASPTAMSPWSVIGGLQVGASLTLLTEGFSVIRGLHLLEVASHD